MVQSPCLKLLEEWEAKIEDMLDDGGQMEIMRDWGAKLAGATVRLAAVMHCVERSPTECIGGTTIESAVEIARYLIPHADSVLNMMLAEEESGDADAQYVLRWIERHGRQEFTKRDAQQHGKRRFKKADDIDPTLGELTRRGYIRMRPTQTTGPGRPPSPTFEVNPTAFAKGISDNCSQNSQNPAGELEGGNSGNTGSASEQFDNPPRIQVTL